MGETKIAASREDGPGLAGAVDELLPSEPDLAYANFAPIATQPGAARAMHRRRWLEGKPVGVFVARLGSGRATAAVRAEHRDFESSHFDLRMAKIDPPLASADPVERTAGLRAAYRCALDALREDGYAHVAARVSTRDRAAPWVLQELGGVHVDTQVSWMCALTGTPHDDALPPGLSLEIHEGDDIRTLAPSSWKRLAEWAGHAFDRGPLVFDHTLPYEKALAIYAVWTERVMRGEWADAVILVRDGDEIAAFNSIQHLPDVSEAAATTVVGRGLGATLPGYRGLFTAVQLEMIARRPLRASFLENETQVATIGSINVYARLGNRFLRSTSTIHFRLDGARRT